MWKLQLIRITNHSDLWGNQREFLISAGSSGSISSLKKDQNDFFCGLRMFENLALEDMDNVSTLRSAAIQYVYGNELLGVKRTSIRFFRQMALNDTKKINLL